MTDKTDAVIGRMTKRGIAIVIWSTVIYILYQIQVGLLNGYLKGQECFFGCEPIKSQFEIVIELSFVGFGLILYLVIGMNKVAKPLIRWLSKYEVQVRRKEKK